MNELTQAVNENSTKLTDQEEKEMSLRAESFEALIPSVLESYTKAADNPVNCTGSLPPFTDVRRGQIASEIIIAKDYYMDPRNQEGTLDERREKLNAVIKKVFSNFIEQRTKEYKSVRCHYRGIDWNKPGNSSWKTITCQPGFYFIKETLVRTTNGDWKEGPVWGQNYSSLSWKTGGHRRSETFAEVDAEYFQIDQKVIDELNSARKILHDRGIPTELP